MELKASRGRENEEIGRSMVGTPQNVRHDDEKVQLAKRKKHNIPLRVGHTFNLALFKGVHSSAPI
jgi:hypothetical protein